MIITSSVMCIDCQDVVGGHNMEELERRLLEQKLQRQQQQSAADARWLQAEEQGMVRPSSITAYPSY